MGAPADVRSHYYSVRCDTRATLLCWASKKEVRSLDNEPPTCRLSSGATLPLLAGIFIPAEALCTAFDRRSFCPNAGMEQPQLDGNIARSKPVYCWDNLCALRSKSLNRIPEGNHLRIFSDEHLQCDEHMQHRSAVSELHVAPASIHMMQ